ncbi:GNAT family N-acetyltransferase [Pontibacter ramchanderi]|nr:GNAT family N-acetyltransferase [Pontibacter ramchanderi]
MTLTFRSITLADAEALALLSLQFGYKVRKTEMAERIAQLLAHQEHCGFVACVDAQVVGWVHGFYTLRLESAPFVEIGGLVVEENLRGQGIGRQLIMQVKAWAMEKSVSKLRVRCHTSRVETHTFYRKLGFAESKEQKVFDLLL